MKKIFFGRVSSDKMIKTAVVVVSRKKRHPLFKRVIEKRKKLYADNILGAKIGDIVKVEETRPLSKLKRFKIIEIIKDH